LVINSIEVETQEALGVSCDREGEEAVFDIEFTVPTTRRGVGNGVVDRSSDSHVRHLEKLVEVLRQVENDTRGFSGTHYNVERVHCCER
jgi:hypothetical protein